MATLRRLVSDDSLGDRVTFTGPLNGNAKWEAMAAATMLVLPSYQENFALVVAEGMRIGLPVVLSRRVNIWTDVVEAGAGFACELSIDSVAEAISRLLSDLTLAERAARQGQRLATERFTWDRSAAAVAAVYTEVLQGASAMTCGV